MRTQDSVEKLVELVPLLNPTLMRSKLAEYQRGGLPGASMSDGRGGEPPLPLMGHTDRKVLIERREYEQALSHAALAVETAMRLQRYWCERLPTDTEKAKALAEDGPKGAGLCSNLFCDHVCTGFGNDRLRHGRCRPCYRIFTLEGKDRDPRKEVAS